MLKRLLVCGLSTGFLSSAAMAIELTDYTEPNTSFDEAYVDFNANAEDGNQDQVSYNALLNAFYNGRRSTDQRVLTLRLDGFADAARGPNENDDTVDDYGVGTNVNLDQYFGAANDEFFYFGEFDYAYRESAEDDAIGFTVGIGYGRVWNATPLAKALRIQEDLEEIGMSMNALSDEELLRLAEIIGREDEYRASEGPDLYRGTWYSDMEQVLDGAGVLPEGEDGLSALGTVKLDDILVDEPISPRRHGWLVRAGAGFQASDFSGLTDNDPKLTFQFEYAKPFGLRGQLIEVARYEPVFGDNTVHSLDNRLSYTYEISDVIDWINIWDLNAQQADDDDNTRFIVNTLSSTFLYELTNSLDLGLTLAAEDVDERPDTDDSNDDIDTSARLNLRYRLY